MGVTLDAAARAGEQQSILFVGVTTGGSTMLRLFPRWAAAIGLEADLAGVDLPVGASADQYRGVLQRMRDDPAVLGAVVTTHKLGLVAAGRDLFAWLDPLAARLGEVNAIARREGALYGYARDPAAVTTTLAEMLGADYWTGDADVLCLGAGGAGTAIALSLCGGGGDGFEAMDGPLRPITPGPRRFIAVATRPERLTALQRVLDPIQSATSVEYRCHTVPAENDALLADLPPRSLVINATGMGKDLPGSPVTDAALFPDRAVIWELNYRGPRPFLARARAQETDRQLAVHDGWRYFLHGWAAALGAILERDLSGAAFAPLADLAADLQPAAAGQSP